MFASDDADARAAARRLGIRVTGTLGILALTVRRELLTLAQANPAEQLTREDLHLVCWEYVWS